VEQTDCRLTVESHSIRGTYDNQNITISVVSTVESFMVFAVWQQNLKAEVVSTVVCIGPDAYLLQYSSHAHSTSVTSILILFFLVIRSGFIKRYPRINILYTFHVSSRPQAPR
jgi:hypothetical protein